MHSFTHRLLFHRLFSSTLSLHCNMLTLLYPEVWHWHLECNIIVIALITGGENTVALQLIVQHVRDRLHQVKRERERERGRENKETNGKESE